MPHARAIVVLIALSAVGPQARAQWPTNDSLTRLGLTSGTYVSGTGFHFSSASFVAPDGSVTGFTTRSATGAFGRNAWVFRNGVSTQIGLVGVDNTSTTNTQIVNPLGISATGRVMGTSARYVGTSDNGIDAWFFNGSSTVPIGLTGGVYTGSSGYQSSEPKFIDSSGRVCGISRRYMLASTLTGTDVWLYDGSTQQIGLFGGIYINSQGATTSDIIAMNAAGQVTGYTSRFADPNSTITTGRQAWVWRNGTNTPIGLTGGVWTVNFAQDSAPVKQNAAGQVLGTSRRHLAPTGQLAGYDSWLWSPTGGIVQVGLFGGIYLATSGSQESTALLLSEAGHAVGTSVRWNGDAGRGSDAWISFNGTNTLVGLTTGAFATSTGSRVSTPVLVTNAGLVAGTSQRYSLTDATNGLGAWVFSGTSTVQTGLTTSAHTGSGGFQSSTPTKANDAGYVIGTSNRVTGVSSSNGTDAWVFKPNGTTQQLGLTGGIYTTSAGKQNSNPVLINSAGRIAGTSERYNTSGASIGQDVWYYDPATNVTSSVPASVLTTTNAASATPVLLTDDGILYGFYTFYAGGVGAGEQRAFAYRPDRGFTDLQSFVAGGIASAGWTALRGPTSIGAGFRVIGTGFVTGQTGGQSVFVLKASACTGCNLADITALGGAGSCGDGQLTADDLIAFLTGFFNRTAVADVAGLGGTIGADGQWTADDLIAFLNAFFAGCP